MLPYNTHDFKGYRHPFVVGITYLGGVGDNPRTVNELAMSKYSAFLRRQQQWWTKFHDDNARAEWRKLAKQSCVSTVQTPSSLAHVELSEQQVEYIIDELAGYAALRDEKNGCQVSCFERIWESNTLLSDLENSTLHLSLAELEHLPTCTRSDDGNTINIIDPMLHCLVYNRSLVSFGHRLPRPIASPPEPDIYTVCRQFALLPADVSVDEAGGATFLSYINNLHKDDHVLQYNLLEGCLTKLMPLFEHTLTDLHRNNPIFQRIPGPCKYTVWEEPEPPEHSDDEEGWSTYERELRHWVMNRPLQLPDLPSTGYPGGIENRKYNVSLRGRLLQVIVEVTETRLRPDGPEFSGAAWSVKGMRNERIAACGIHCLSAENISSASIEFRMAVSYPRGFSAGDTGATLRTWGLSDGDACHQYIGETPLRPGLSFVFPNIYQHRLTSFKLDNSTRHGRLALLMFYLVDPEIQPVVSTSRVAPQQKEWIQRAVEAALSPKLPLELIHEVLRHVSEPMELEEAEDYRRAFLDIHANFRQASNNYHFCIPFDVWNGPDFSHPS